MAQSSYTIQGVREGAIRLLVGPNGAVVNRVVTFLRRTTNRAKLNAPVDTGYLRNSHRYDPPVVNGLRVSGEVRATANYARALHDGIPEERVIRPVNGKVLAFPGRDGQMVFRRSVTLPPRPARPWLLNAARAEGPRLGFNVTDTQR